MPFTYNQDKNFLTAREISFKLNVSVRTLSTWYQWYTDPKSIIPPDCPGLPKYTIQKSCNTRLWRVEDLQCIADFQKWIPHGRRGVMGKINRKFWSTSKTKAVEK